MNLSYLPNIISVIRIILVVPIIFALLLSRYDIGLMLFACAGFSDSLDGFLAKRYGWQTRLGSLLDPLADKLLLVASYIVIGWLGLLPPWLVILIILRDIIIITGATIYYSKVGRFTGKPTFMSKLNTVIQITLILLVVSNTAFSILPIWTEIALIFIATIATLASGIDYIIKWCRRVRYSLRTRRHHGNC